MTKATSEYNLEITNKKLVSEWHPTKNKSLLPSGITSHSGKKIWWLCIYGHEWNASVNDRSGGHGCPYCAGTKPTLEKNLAATFPELCQEWSCEKNGTLVPQDLLPYSDKKVWWICVQGHVWLARVADRTAASSGCPYCSGRFPSPGKSLGDTRPHLVSQWHKIKNSLLTPFDVLPFSNKKVWWICDKGHEWQARIYDRTRNHGCPNCYNRISKKGMLWLDSLGLLDDSEHREVAIVVGTKLHIVDGFDPKTGTVYEFLGDYWHGNPEKFDFSEKNPSCGMTYGHLFKRTIARLATLSKAGFKVIYKWESAGEHKEFKPHQHRLP